MLVLLTCHGLQGCQEDPSSCYRCQLRLAAMAANCLQSQQIISVAVLMHCNDCKQHYAQCLMCRGASLGFPRGSKGTPPGRKTQSQDFIMKVQSFLCPAVHTCSFAVKSTLQPVGWLCVVCQLIQMMKLPSHTMHFPRLNSPNTGASFHILVA